MGEIIARDGTPWIRYRAWVGSDEAIMRIDLSMTSMGAARPGDVPRPLLTARRERDRVVIEPAEPGLGITRTDAAVDSAAFLTIGSSTGMTEQAIRRVRHMGRGTVRLREVEAMGGQLWEATFTPGNHGALTVTVGPETWRFTLDAGGSIRSADCRLDGRMPGFRELEIHRIDSRAPLAIRRPVTLPDTAGQVKIDRLKVRWARLDAVEREFRRTLHEGRATAIRVAAESAVEAMGLRGGAYQSMLCTDVAMALLRDGDKTFALLYAHRAVAYANSHDVLSFGDQGLLQARISSRRALAEALFAHGHADSAYLLVRQAMALPREEDELALQRDLRLTLAGFQEFQGRPDDAIATLFEAVALDTCHDLLARAPLHRVWMRRFGEDTDLDQRIEHARERKCANEVLGGGGPMLDGARAPEWALSDLNGAVRRSSSFAGRPTVLVFWGGWTSANRSILRTAEDWYRHRSTWGVNVVSINWELPGPGPVSRGLAAEAIARGGYRLPVLLDHDQAVFKRFGGELYPAIVLIGRDGRVRLSTSGGMAARNQKLSASVRALGRAL
ncbi:MAG: TlpA family protein disulfide reductase [Candidatus Eisenbacteria bacterium]|uniref:TlpA family protein disulfide reductase n=1 Tax=Eiseniibacteriota bacterium TaxID=2212470 RepID=A0A9D6L4T7_UNCEI|nr:TlpA family protein disulfide reductase [Candidatus Eisenbacteria bacterium]